MQLRPPPENVILDRHKQELSVTLLPQKPDKHAQIRVHPGHLRVRHTLRQRLEPPVRPPLERVLAPDRLAAVRGEGTEADGRALRYEDRVEHLPVAPADGRRQREHSVLARPSKWSERER